MSSNNRLGAGRVGRIYQNGHFKQLVARSAVITVLPQPEGDLPTHVVANTRIISPVQNRKKERRKKGTETVSSLPPELKQFSYPLPKIKLVKKSKSVPHGSGLKDIDRIPKSPATGPVRLPRTAFTIQPRRVARKSSLKLEKSPPTTPRKTSPTPLRRNSTDAVTTATQTQKRVVRSRTSNSIASSSGSSRPFSESSSSTVSVGTQTRRPKKKKLKKSPSLPSIVVPPIVPPILLPNDDDTYEEPVIDPDPDFSQESPALDQSWADEPIGAESAPSPPNIYDPGTPTGDAAPSVTDPIDMPRVLHDIDDDNLYEQPPELPPAPTPDNIQQQENDLVEDKTPEPAPPKEPITPEESKPDPDLENPTKDKPNEEGKPITQDERKPEADKPQSKPATPPQEKPPTEPEPPESPKQVEEVPKPKPDEPKNNPIARRNSAPSNTAGPKQRQPTRPRPTSAKTPARNNWAKAKEANKNKNKLTDPFFGKNAPKPKPAKTGSKSLNRMLEEFFAA